MTPSLWFLHLFVESSLLFSKMNKTQMKQDHGTVSYMVPIVFARYYIYNLMHCPIGDEVDSPPLNTEPSSSLDVTTEQMPPTQPNPSIQPISISTRLTPPNHSLPQFLPEEPPIQEQHLTR